jgi:hypothetical protein
MGVMRVMTVIAEVYPGLTVMLLVRVLEPIIVVGRNWPAACVLNSATESCPVYEPPPRHKARL